MQIEYESQKKFPDCLDKQQLRFDFYLPKFNLLIELDGQQHFEDVYFDGKTSHLELTRHHDQINYLSDHR
jgi:very-short-patch-repair endonuclease